MPLDPLGLGGGSANRESAADGGSGLDLVTGAIDKSRDFERRVAGYSADLDARLTTVLSLRPAADLNMVHPGNGVVQDGSVGTSGRRIVSVGNVAEDGDRIGGVKGLEEHPESLSRCGCSSQLALTDWESPDYCTQHFDRIPQGFNVECCRQCRSDRFGQFKRLDVAGWDFDGHRIPGLNVQKKLGAGRLRVARVLYFFHFNEIKSEKIMIFDEARGGTPGAVIKVGSNLRVVPKCIR